MTISRSLASCSCRSQDGSVAPGLHLEMYQVKCNLKMPDVRHARYRLLIETCRQFDPVKLAQAKAEPV